MADETNGVRDPNPHAEANRVTAVLDKLNAFHRAVRSGERGIYDLRVEYPRLGRARRERFVSLVDAFADALARAWKAMRDEVLGPNGD